MAGRRAAWFRECFVSRSVASRGRACAGAGSGHVLLRSLGGTAAWAEFGSNCFMGSVSGTNETQNGTSEGLF